MKIYPNTIYTQRNWANTEYIKVLYIGRARLDWKVYFYALQEGKVYWILQEYFFEEFEVNEI